MITSEAVVQMALALPEAEEKEHWGRPSFRVRNKIFATLRADENRAVLKLPLVDQEMVVRARPAAFALAPWEHQGWTFVQLTQVDEAEFGRLLVLAWQNVAPKRLVAAYEAQAGE
jgi:hypothetical protein